MKRYMIMVAIVMAILVAAWTAFGQDQERAGQREEFESMRERFQNMSEAEREQLRAEIRERRERFQNMSEAEKEKLRAEMRERFAGSAGRRLGREGQLNAIKEIEGQVAKLKAAVEGMPSADRERFQGLSEEDRAKLREKMSAGFRDQQMAIRAIEEQLARLRGPERPRPDAGTPIRELRAIHELAVTEKAAKTAERLEKLIARYQREPAGRVVPAAPPSDRDAPRPPRERPARPPRNVE
jgi:hypothetical protein